MKISHDCRVAVDIFLRQLEDSSAQFAHHAHQLPDLVPTGQAAGNRAVIGRFVIAVARGAEACRPSRMALPNSRFIAARSSDVVSAVKARSPMT